MMSARSLIAATVCAGTVMALTPALAATTPSVRTRIATIASPRRPPARVTALRATAQGARSVKLSWTNPTGSGFAGVEVRRAAGSSAPSRTSGQLTSGVSRRFHSVVVTQLAAGHRYTFAVFARYSHGRWARGAAETTVTAPGPVTTFTATPSDGAVALSWTNPNAVGLADVVVRRSVGAVAPASPDAGQLVTVVAAPAHGYVDNTVSSDTVYSYAVFARNSSGNDSSAATARATSPSDAPAPCTDSWTGAQSSAWATAANWSTGAVPSSTDVACLPSDAPNLPPTISDSRTVGAINNDGGLNIAVGGGLELTGDNETSTSNGSLTDDGTLTVDASPGLQTSGPVGFGGGAALAGAGTLTTTGSTTIDSLADGLATWSDRGPTSLTSALTIEGNTNLHIQGTLALAGGHIDGDCTYPAGETLPELVVSGNVDSSGDAAIGIEPVSRFDCLAVAVGGTLDVASGSLGLKQGGPGSFTSGSTLDVENGATVDTPAAQFDQGATVIVRGTLATDGLLVMDADATISTLAIDGPDPQDGGIIVGTGNVVVTKYFDASNARLGVEGSLTVSPTATATLALLTIGPTVDDVSASPTLVNQGTSTVPDSGVVDIAAGNLSNVGTLDLDADSDLDGRCLDARTAELTNSGAVVADGADGEPVSVGSPPGFGGSCLTVSDTGRITISSGTLRAGGNFEFANGSTVTLSAGGTLALTDAATVDSGASVASAAQVTLDGDLTLNEPLSVNYLDMVGGELLGPETLTVTTRLSATGGEIDSGGDLSLASTATGTVAGLVVTGELDNAGTLTIPPSAPDAKTSWLYVERGGRVLNTGNVYLGSYAVITGACGGSGLGPGLMTNDGQILSFGGSGSETGIGTDPQLPDEDVDRTPTCLDVDDNGVLRISTGTLEFEGAGTTIEPAASVTVGSDATLAVMGDVTVDAGASVSIAGELAVDPNADDLASTLTLDVDVSIPDLSLGDGTVRGSGAITLTGQSSSDDGTVATTGGTTVATGAALTVTGVLDIDGTLTNDGLISMPAPNGSGGELDIPAGATLDNNAMMSVASGTVSGGCPHDSTPVGKFDSSGSIVTSGDSGIGTSLIGSGEPPCLATTVTGEVSIRGGLAMRLATLEPGASVTDPASSQLDLSTSTVAQGATISGAGGLAVGNVTVYGDHTLPAIEAGGTFEIGPGATVTTPSFRPQTVNLKVDSADGGPWGQIVTTGNVDLTFNSLILDATDYTPACGTNVTALTSTAVDHPFGSASGPAPAGATWTPTSTDASAGAVLNC
jgi:hypothetical protein